MNDVPAVIVNVQRQPGANIINVVDRIVQLLPRLTATLPPAVSQANVSATTAAPRRAAALVHFVSIQSIGLQGNRRFPAL